MDVGSTAAEALRELDVLEYAWGAKYKAVVRLWRQLGQHHPVLPVPSGDSQDDLHDQRDRIVEYGHAQVHAQSAHLSERRLHTEVVVPGDPRSVEELEIDPPLETGAAELSSHVRRRTCATGGTVNNQVTQFV